MNQSNSPIIFKCNATSQTGFGHVSRCLNIANMIQSISPQQTIAFCGEYLPFAQTQIQRSGFSVLASLSPETANSCIVIDDYQLTQNDIDNLRRNSRCLIAIDDFNTLDLSTLDLIVNFRVGFENEQYGATATCLGAKYFPFKPALQQIRTRNFSQEKNILRNIFIFIGGQDNHHTGQKLLSALDSTLKNKRIHLVSADTQQPDEIQSEYNVLLRKPLTANIEQYYEEADYFISGGGLSKYEVSFCGIANACISQNAGQAQDSLVFAQRQLTTDLGLVDNFIANPEKCLTELVDDIEAPKQSALLSASREIFDTHSCHALADNILKRCYDQL